MKQLEPIIQSATTKLVLVDKTEKGYVYERTNMTADIVESYEVFEHKVNTYYNCVSYPGDNAFGKWAWCISALDPNAKQKALEKLYNLK